MSAAIFFEDGVCVGPAEELPGQHADGDHADSLSSAACAAVGAGNFTGALGHAVKMQHRAWRSELCHVGAGARPRLGEQQEREEVSSK